VTAHPAALVLADHQPVYVSASTKPAAMVRCSCNATVQWCDFATHQAEALVAAGLLTERRGLNVSIHDLLLQYLVSRGIPMPEITTGRKVLEEARELVDAIGIGDIDQIADEVGDVVLVAAVIAQAHGLTVEDCVRGKTARDAGRGGGALAEEEERWALAAMRAETRARMDGS
jgi:phosphoribosyl-ATP pyrophosphohydrolase